jgi:predicted dehydrogenase
MLPALKSNPQVKLVGIASASGMSAQHAVNKFGVGYAASQAEKLLEDPQVDVVAILTRHNLHAAQVLAALAAGKHVFCEKPLALTLDETAQIEAALAESERMLMVGFNRRFAPLAVKLGAFLKGRAEPLYGHYRVNAGYIPLSHWTHDLAQGGGRIIGEGCHFIDFLTYLVGAAPVEVIARGLPDRGRYREDVVSLSFTFPDGSLGVVDYLANGDKAFPKERVEVFCGGKVAVLDDYRSLELTANGRRQSTRSYLRQDKGHAAEWQAFSAALLRGGQPPIPYDQLFGVTRAAIAAVEALRTRTCVRIQERNNGD